MGILDWLLTDPTQADRGFLEALLRGGKPGGATGGAPTTPPPYTAPSSLLGESPLINMLRSGFAGMNAANGYSGFGPQFAAGTVGGANAMAQRRQQLMQDQLDALALAKTLRGPTAQDAPVDAARGSLDGSASQTPAGPCLGNCADRNQPIGVALPSGPNSGVAASPGSGAPSSMRGTPIKVNSVEEAAKLPAGTWFETPDGRIARRNAVGVR